MSKFTVDYFIKKFKKIPSNKWHVGNYHNVEETKFCALGHCNMHKRNTREGVALLKLFGCTWQFEVAEINDGGKKKYLQKTPRSRILAALQDVKSNKFKQEAQ